MNFRFRPIVLTVIVILASTTCQLFGETIVLEPAKDTSIFEDGNLSNGAGIHLFSGKTGARAGRFWRRALIQFDLSSLPAGSTIESVSLSLTVTETPEGNARSYELYRLTANWGEGTSNSGSPGGAGAIATTGDATWVHSFYPDTEWIFEGGDMVFTPSAGTEITTEAAYTWSSELMISDVQGWVDDSSTNFGWAILGPDVDRSARRFASRENSNDSIRPKLTVTYTAGQTHWAAYPILEDGRTVDTGDFLGFVDIAEQPWIYVYEISSYVYLPEDMVTIEGGWAYVPK